MKKLLVTILILILALGFMFKPSTNEEIIVKIYSDISSDIDSVALAKIAEKVDEYLSELLVDIKDSKSAYKIIKENCDNLQNIVNSQLKRLNLAHKATIVAKQLDMPFSNCGDYRLKQGKYNGIEITLGTYLQNSETLVVFPPINNGITRDFNSRFSGYKN